MCWGFGRSGTFNGDVCVGPCVDGVDVGGAGGAGGSVGGGSTNDDSVPRYSSIMRSKSVLNASPPVISFKENRSPTESPTRMCE